MDVLLKKLAKEVKRYRHVVSDPKSKLNLHLGCGSIHIPGWVNVDVMRSSAADIIDDIRRLKKFKNATVDSIYACHVLEHFTHTEVAPILRRWHEVLKPGGELRLSVPDIDKIVQIYHKNWTHFQTAGNSPWVGLIYGGQKDRFDFHKTGFNLCWLKLLLEQSGFDDVLEYAHFPHFIGDNIDDASLAREPFGEFFSLNVLCRKKMK
jgi:predicted SAM-dependent methyltransferase